MAGASAVAAYYGWDPEASGGLRAAIARSKEGLKLSGEKHEPSEKAIRDTWDKHFNSKTNNFMTLDAWKVIGKSMSVFANISFNAGEQKHEFDQYFALYINEMAEACQTVDLDLELFTISLDYSARALTKDVDGYKSDIAISTAQQLLGPISADLDVQDLVSEKAGVETLGLPIDVGQLPLSYGRAAQLLSANVTTGIMDYEISEKAAAVFDKVNQKIGDEMVKSYPVIANELRLVDAFAIRREIERSNLAHIIEDNLDVLIPSLVDFFRADTQNESFNAIGISKELDEWQKIQPTRVWQRLYYPNNLTDKEVVTSVISEYNTLYQDSPENAAIILIREQIMNPKFLDHLEKSGLNQKLLKELNAAVRKLEITKSNLVSALYKAQEAEAPYEFDPKYQCLTAAAMTKKMFDEVVAKIGTFGKTSKDEVALFAFGMQTIREGARPNYLINSRLGLDLRVDAPYEKDLVTSDFAEFVSRVEEFTGKQLRDDIRWVDPEELRSAGAREDLISLAQYWAWFNSVNMGTIKYYFETDNWIIQPAPWDNY